MKKMLLQMTSGFLQLESTLTYIARSNEILGWEGVGNRQLLCFFKA
jgi:hypothetical protein